MIDATYVFSTINSIAVVVTVVVLIMQTRSVRKEVGILQEQTQSMIDSNQAQNHAGLREIIFKIDEVFFQKPEIRKYFYDGAPIDEKSPDYACAEATAELVLDIMEHMLWQYSCFPKLYGVYEDENILRRILDAFIIDMFISSSLLAAYVDKRRTWYTPQLLERRERAQHIISQRNAASI